MLEGLLLIIDVIMLHAALLGESVRIQAHATSNAALSGEASFRIKDGSPTLSGLDEFGVLLLENLEVPLGLPVPDAVSSEQKVHFLKGALVRLRVQSPHHRQRDGVGGREDVVRLFIERLEHDGAKQGEPAIAHGPTNNTPRIALGAHFEREDLSRIEPRNSQPSRAEGRCEEEDHSNSS